MLYSLSRQITHYARLHMRNNHNLLVKEIIDLDGGFPKIISHLALIQVKNFYVKASFKHTI